MLTIRLHRIGKTNQPSYKIVVVDKKKSAAAGSFVEDVGFLNRAAKVKKMNAERLKYWLSKGAQPSPTVHNLLVAENIAEGKKIAVHAKPKKKEAGNAPAEAAKPEAAPPSEPAKP